MLLQDMLHHIHSLMPVQDAGRAACVSRRFLCSWRCYSNLKLNIQTLGLTGDKSEGSEIYFINKVDKILNNYSDKEMKVKTLKLDLGPCSSVSASYLDRWLKIAVKSGIDPEHAEFLACRRGIQLEVEAGARKVLLETDNQGAMQVLRRMDWTEMDLSSRR